VSQNIKKGTVLSALMWASEEFRSAGIESYRLDAELLLSEVLKISRVGLYLNFDRPMNKDEKERFLSLVRRRIKREPVAYILNRKEFMTVELYVDNNVLIPRPETECLVEWILKNVQIGSESRVIDIGTGSGCIAIALLKYTPIKHIYITDVSEGALAVAERNIKTIVNDKQYTRYLTSLMDGINEWEFDIVVSNPPYIKRGELKELMPDIIEYEPRLALDGGERGDEIITKLIAEAHLHLKKEGLLIFEHGDDYNIDEGLINGKYELVHKGKDYSNRNRFVVLKKI